MHRCSKVTKILRIHFNGLGGQRGKLYIPCQKLTQVSLRGGGGGGGGEGGRKGASNIAQSNQERGSFPAGVIS